MALGSFKARLTNIGRGARNQSRGEVVAEEGAVCGVEIPAVVHRRAQQSLTAEQFEDVPNQALAWCVDPNGARGVRPNKSLIQQIATYAPEDASGEKFLTPEAFEVFVETFARTGFTGGINWYRNFSRNWLEAEKLPLRVDGLPCLMLTAELDPILPPSAASQMPSLVGDLEMAMVKGSGHWTQQERPDEVNRLILDWLGRRFSFSKAKG